MQQGFFNHFFNNKAAFFAVLLVLAGQSVAAAPLNDRFSIGVTGGYSSWDTNSSLVTRPPLSGGGPGREIDDSAASVGVAVRYTAPINEMVFAGIHIGWQKDFVNISEELLIGTISARVKGDVDWSMDFLGRIGMHAGSVAPYIAVGPSIARGAIKVLADDVTYADNKTHLGFKIAVGIDFPVTDQISAFIQGEYADYVDKTYSDDRLPGIRYKIDADTLGGRVGLMYRF